MKSKICAMSNELLRSHYPSGKENIRLRAHELLTSGSVIYSTVKFLSCSSRIDNTLKILLFKVNITPSMKSKLINMSISLDNNKLFDHYTVYLAFDAINKNVLPYLYTLCAVMMAVTLVHIY